MAARELMEKEWIVERFMPASIFFIGRKPSRYSCWKRKVKGLPPIEETDRWEISRCFHSNHNALYSSGVHNDVIGKIRIRDRLTLDKAMYNMKCQMADAEEGMQLLVASSGKKLPIIFRLRNLVTGDIIMGDILIPFQDPCSEGEKSQDSLTTVYRVR